MKKTKSAGGVVINQEGKIMVVSQKGTSWSLPKGHMNEGEEELAAAKREIFEESGITDLELVKKLGTYRRFALDSKGKIDRTELKTITLFLFKSKTEELKPIDPENPEARWVVKEEVVNYLLHKKDREFFLSSIDEINAVIQLIRKENIMKDKIQREPKFVPKEGQTDYTNIRRAPVVNCVVKHKDKILLVKRNSGMRLYPGEWSGIAGYLDDNKGIEGKVKEELKEEIGIEEDDIVSMKRGQPFDWDEPRYDKVWATSPVLVELTTDKIRLNWEAQDYKWVKPEEVREIKVIPSFNKVLKTFFPDIIFT